MTYALNALFALLLLSVVLPTIFLLAVLIVLIDHHSPFYRQKRPGKNGKVFTCYKLQSMHKTNDESLISNITADQLRITPFGRILRDHGWDELPQIFNIIFGDINFIGHRPIHKNNYRILENDKTIDRAVLAKWHRERQTVLPGLTGWQQIHQLSFRHDPAAAIQYDLGYLHDPSIRKKLKIILLSVIIVFVGKNRYFKRGLS